MSVESVLVRIPSDNLITLSDMHIRRYENLLRSSSSYVRKSECKQYAEIWRSIKVKNGQGLTTAERNEVYDAITSGEYDDLLMPDVT
jgi:hypothetical protein